MKTIKFRQRVKGAAGFHYWGWEIDDAVFVGPIINTSELVSEQFTGIIDDNGQEIYEGDIVRWQVNHIRKDGIVEYVPDFGVYDLRNFKDQWHVGCDWGRGEYVVRGNIHENPELLEANP